MRRRALKGSAILIVHIAEALPTRDDEPAGEQTASCRITGNTAVSLQEVLHASP